MLHVSISPHGAWRSPGLLESRVLVFSRFGVIHSVFTNLLLWANSVLNESKHQLNEHKERLLTLGFGNITIGECESCSVDCREGCRGQMSRDKAQVPENCRARPTQPWPDDPLLLKIFSNLPSLSSWFHK